MADQDGIGWETCTVDGCIGARLDHAQTCWAHADEPGLEPALQELGEHGHLDARGVTFTSDLLRRVLTSAPRDDDGHGTLSGARFDQATFTGKAGFEAVTFHGRTTFTRATFHNDAGFDRATFQDDVWFDRATFHRVAAFGESAFHGRARFNGAIFDRDARFGHATFQQDACFDRVAFHRVVFFNGTVFRRDASFHRATLRDATFDRAIVHRDAWFGHTGFERVKSLGPMLVGRNLVLDNAVFHERVQIDVTAAVLCARRARFLAGTHLRVRWAEVVLDGSDLAATSIVSGVPSPFTNLDEGRWAQALERLRRIQRINGRPGRPRLMSLRRADVTGLTVAGLDLRACRFVGAHNLDRLRIEECDLAPLPWFRGAATTWATPRTRGWGRPTRRAIAEEHDWRARRHRRGSDAGSETHGPGWFGRAQRPPSWLDAGVAPTATQVAAIYRDLRKGREDTKDEPGAADFYYGEMEMRRHATSRRARKENREDGNGPFDSSAAGAAGEHAILWFYWLVSGYGLRAWRALATLATLVLLTCVAFAFWGFASRDEPGIRPVAVDDEGDPVYAHVEPERPAGLDELPQAIRFSAQSTAALLRGPDDDTPLTPVGEWLHLALRLIGPLLLGLGILSIRGRVKR